jgi:hypothetical protein
MKMRKTNFDHRKIILWKYAEMNSPSRANKDGRIIFKTI